MALLPSVCVIGAGSSGIAAAKALHQRGFAFDCFEASDRVGGMWVFKNPNGRSAAYKSLHINTSRERMEFADFPMPRSYPDFPHHSHIAEYFDAYVDHFGFRERITFGTAVTRAEPRAGGGTQGTASAETGWEVSLDTGETRSYDALLVANGHHWDPRWPEPGFPGQEGFAGVLMHAHDYRGEDPALFRDRTVVVLGMGNSAMDIAVEASFHARTVYLAARRGAWVVPKYVFGRPLDQLPTSARVPVALRRRLQEAVVRAAVGSMETYGLPRPDHHLGQAHPTISDDVLSRLAHGAITAKPNLESFAGRTVRFLDGSEVDADVVVFCTGYRVSFPFFAPELIAAPGNELPLFRRVFHPQRRDVFFVGLLQPLGAVMPLAALQSDWLCDHLAGDYHLPPDAELRADIASERRAMAVRYVASPRHTMQVDFEDYVAGVARERRRGAARAALAGHALPVVVRSVAAATAG